ncbi:MAG: hypothetical protein NTU51_09460 [Bacteroidetes bacterium]|nr:hypothetical protein [Bacteroidota bacterium]
MKIRLPLILFLYFSLFGFPGFSQKTFNYYSGRDSWRLPYTGYYHQKTNYGNDILEELAKDLLKPPKFVNISLGFRENISLSELSPSLFQASLALMDFDLSGYLQYRSFTMKEVMAPSEFRLSLKLSTKLDTGTFKPIEFKCGDPMSSSVLTFRTNVLAMDTAVDTLILGDFSFSYSQACWQRFYDRKDLIDDYYAASAMIDSLGREAQQWDMRESRSIPLNFIRLSELVRMIDLIRERDFGNSLLMGANDSKHLLDSHLDLYKISRTCQFNLAETLEKSGVINGYSTLDSVNDFFIERLMRYIRFTSLMENINGKIYKDYLNLYYSRHVFEDDAEFAKSILIRMFPDARPDSLLTWASESLMQAYRKKAQELMAGKKYSEALSLMENARSMAVVNPYLHNHNGWENLMSEAVNGIYSSYTGIASSSLEAGNVKFAMEYLQKAENYRQIYPVYITSDTVYHRVYRAIFIGQLDQCNNLLEEGNYREALDCLKSCELNNKGKALEILAADISLKEEQARMGIISSLAGKCIKELRKASKDSALSSFDRASLMLRDLLPGNRKVRVLDSLAPSIAILRAGKINAMAVSYFNQRQFARAILQFELAGKISAEYSLPTDPVIDSIYTQSYKQWLLDRISQEQRLIWSNKPDSAGNFLQLATRTAMSKGLESDPDILKALALYKSRISNRSCEMMEDSLILYNIRAGRCFALHNFNRGVRILQDAMRQAGRYPQCRFDTDHLQDSITRYRDPAEYMNKLDEVTICMATGEYERGLQILAENEKFYTLKRIDHFGISLTSVYDYIVSKANPFISMQALDYYCTLNEPAEALRYLVLLHMQGMPEERSLAYQEKLARELCARDRIAYGDADPQNMVSRYTSSNSWMRRFTEVYVQFWKK